MYLTCRVYYWTKSGQKKNGVVSLKIQTYSDSNHVSGSDVLRQIKNQLHDSDAITVGCVTDQYNSGTLINVY